MKKILIILNMALFLICCGLCALHYFHKDKTTGFDYKKTKTIASNLPRRQIRSPLWTKGLLSKGEFLFDRGRALLENSTESASGGNELTKSGSELPIKLLSVMGQGANGRIFIAPVERGGFKAVNKKTRSSKQFFRVGEEVISGYVLIDVLKDGAVLEKNTKKITITIEKAGMGTSKNNDRTKKDRLIIGPSSE